MNFVLFISLVSCACGVKYGNTGYDTTLLPPLPPVTFPEGIVDDITVTVYETRDTYTTVTDKFYNTVPIIFSEFRKSTVTLPTREIIRTPVDNVVKIQTQLVTQFTTTETVTDVLSRYRCHTEASTDLFTVTHFDQRFLHKTVLSVLVKTLTFRPTIVRTVLSTEKELFTETEFITRTIWAFPGEQPKYSYF